MFNILTHFITLLYMFFAESNVLLLLREIPFWAEYIMPLFIVESNKFVLH